MQIQNIKMVLWTADAEDVDSMSYLDEDFRVVLLWIWKQW